MSFLEDLINKVRGKVYNSDIAQNARTAWNTPTTQAEHPTLSFLNSLFKGGGAGVAGGTGLERTVADKAGFTTLNSFQPQSIADKIGYGAGYIGGQIANPITRGASLLQTGKNALWGGAFGAGTSAISDILNGDQITLQKTMQGAANGAKYSWLYPYTSSAVDKSLIAAANRFPSVAKFVAPLTEKALADSTASMAMTNGLTQFVPKLAGNIAKGAIREGIETPLESTAFAGMDSLNNKKPITTNLKDRIAGDFITNLLMGGARGGATSLYSGFKGTQNQKLEKPAVETTTQPQPDVTTETPIEKLMKSPEYKAEELRIKTQTQKVADLTGYPIEKIDSLIKKGYTPEEIVATVRKTRAEQGMTPISDILSKKNISVTDTQSSPTAEMDFKKAELVKKTGLDPKFIDQKIAEGHTPEKIYSAYSYAKDGTMPVKNMEGYVSKALQTDNFSKEANQATSKPPVVDPNITQPKGYKYDSIKTPNDLNVLKEASIKVDNPENKSKILQSTEAFGKGLEAELQARGVKFSDFVDQVESGKVDPKLQDLADTSQKFFNDFADVGAKRNNVFPMSRKNYWHRISEANLAGKAPKDFGEILFNAGYSKSRTGKLTDYVKDPRVFSAYASEAIGPVSKEETGRTKLANSIINDVQSKVRIDGETKIESTAKDVSITDKIQQAQEAGDIPKPEAKTVYDAPKQNIIVRSVDNLLTSTNELADPRRVGQKFYDDFLYPFRQAQAKVNEYSSAVEKLSPEALKAEYRKVTGKSGQDMTDEEMHSAVTLAMYKAINARAANNFTQNVEKADFKQPYLKDLTDQIFNEYVSSEIKVPKTIDKVMSAIRANTGRGALGLNVASAINNVLEIRRIVASVDSDSFKKGFDRVAKGENFTEKYGVDSAASTALERMYGKRTMLSNALKTMDKGLFYMFDKSEAYKDNIMLAGLEEQGVKKGLSGENLTKFVFQKFDQYAIKYGKGQDIGMFRHPAVKTILQFAQYPIKDLMLAIRKTGGALAGDKGDTKYLAKYVLSTIAQMIAFKATLGVIGFGNQTNTPLDLFSKGISPSPIISLATGLVQNAFASNGESEFDKEKRLKTLRNNALVVGVPASNQLVNKTGAYWTARNNGEYKTFSGNTAGPVGNGVADTVKGTLFGPAYDSKRQKYFTDTSKGQTPALTKNESGVYRSLPADKKEAFYNKSGQLDQQRAETTRLKSGEAPKQSFFDKLTGKQPDKVKLIVPDKTSSAQDWKDYTSDFDTRVNLGYDPTDQEVKARYFRDKSAKTTDLKQKEDVYSAMKSVLDNQDLPKEYKDKVIKASGASQADVEYYMSSIEPDEVRLQAIMPLLNNKDHEKTLEVLMKSRRSIADKSLVTDGMIDYL